MQDLIFLGVDPNGPGFRASVHWTAAVRVGWLHLVDHQFARNLKRKFRLKLAIY